MILRKELEEYAKLRGITNIGQAEKDYFQNILLFIIYKAFGKEIVFKGGTALAKCYGLDRFSEDLDFTSEKDFDFKSIEEGLKRFKLEFTVEKSFFERSKSYIIRINGPLFNGNKNSTCKLILDFSLREKTIIKPIIKTIGRFLEEIPSFDVYVMSQEEIFAEKIRTILTRNKARDVYDLYFLIHQNIPFNKKLVNEKLSYYNTSFKKKDFIKAIADKKNIWNTELSGIVNTTPNFEIVLKAIKKIFVNKNIKRLL